MNEYIDWDNFTLEQKEDFFKQIKKESAVNKNIKHPAAKFFEENGWVKIEGFINETMANYFYHYVQLESKRATFIEEREGDNYDSNRYGTFKDHQAPGDFSHYGDLAFDTLLSLGLEKMEIFTGKKLVPTYSYHRLYTKGTELKRHRDRESCEISTTLCLGYDISNIDNKKYVNWNWPMFVEEEGKESVPVHMKPGDMIIYRGCKLYHWRDPFMGLNHAQVFLHYNEVKEGSNNNLYDNRPTLGLGAEYRPNNDEVEKNNIEGEDNTIVKSNAFIVD
jgi:hypothetical protein